MFIAFVPIIFLAVWLILLGRRPEAGIRHTFVTTLLTIFGFIVIVTELLSILGAISLVPFAWLAAATVVVFRRNDIVKGSVVFRRRIAGAETLPLFFAVPTLLIFAITFLLAIVSPPNTYDSMTYHMSRVAHWIQNGSVEFYPTAILRQLYQPPLAEFSILHLQLLSGGDRFANLIQWIALPAVCGVVSLILKTLDQTVKTQWFAVLFCVTMPTAVVQASSTQNDLLASFFVVAFFYFWLLAVKNGAVSNFVFAGIALGLAILTKGTTYLFCFPIGLFFVVIGFFQLTDKTARLRFIRLTLLVVTIGFAVNFGHYARNTGLFGTPVSTGSEEVRTKNLSFKMALANLSRNYAMHLGTFETVDKAIESSLRAVFGDEMKNPDSTWLAADFQFAIDYSTHEDLAGNLFHLLLLTASLVAVFAFPRDARRYLFGAAFTIIAGFLLFSLLLKWQLWGQRLQMPLFMLGACLVAVWLSNWRSWLVDVVAFSLFALAIPFLLSSTPRRIVAPGFRFEITEDRRTKYYKNLPDLQPFYAEAVAVVKNLPVSPDEIGIHIDYNEFEYPLWILLKDDFAAKPFIQHVGVTNVSGTIKSSRPPPEYIISTRSERVINGVEYREIWAEFPLSVLQRK